MYDTVLNSKVACRFDQNIINFAQLPGGKSPLHMSRSLKKYSAFLILLLVFSLQLPGQFYYGTQMDFGKNRVQYNDFYWYFYRYDKFDTYFNQQGKALANYTADFLSEEIARAEEFFDYTFESRLIFIVYNKLSDFRQSNIGLVSGKDYGVFIPPAITSAGEGAVILEISPLMTGKNSPEVDLAKEWFKWYSTSQAAVDYHWSTLKANPTIHVSADVIAKDDPTKVEELELLNAYPNKLIRFWEATPVEIVEHAVDAFNTMLVEPEKYMDLLNSIEAKAKETWPNYGIEY